MTVAIWTFGGQFEFSWDFATRADAMGRARLWLSVQLHRTDFDLQSRLCDCLYFDS